MVAWLVGIMGASGWLTSMLREAHQSKQWMKYAQTHCALQKKTKGRFPLESDQSCWLCEDGVTYCR